MSANNSPGHDLDLSLLNEIADGSDEFIVESIDMFLQQTPELLNLIAIGIKSKDWASATASAHKLKPTLGFFGMLNAQALIQEIEMACKEAAPLQAEITSKFSEAQNTLFSNITALKLLRAEAQARL